MVKQPTPQQDLSADFDHHLVLFPTRSDPRFSSYVPAYVPACLSTELPAPLAAQLPESPIKGVPARSAGSPRSGPRPQVRSYVIREVAVVEVAGRLGDVVEDLDRAVQVAMAEGPRGVVCDLSAMSEGAEAVAVEVLATVGRHVRDWPGIPVAVACPDPHVREALRAHPLGAQLILTVSSFCAISAVLATPVLDVRWLRLAPHPTAPRSSREFVSRTLADLRLSRVIPFASLVVSELVASSSVDAGTEIDLSATWNNGALRLTVRDHGPALEGQRPVLDLHGRRLTLVAGLSRAFGVLPTGDGGKVVWAVLEAPRQPVSTGPHASAAARQEELIRSDARALSRPSLVAGLSHQPTGRPVRPASRRKHTFAQ